MQTVPSLVGTGTAVAAAAAGLVFGQPTDCHTTSTSTPARPASNKRKTASDREPTHHGFLGGSLNLSRPGTSSAVVPAPTPEERPYTTLPQQLPLTNSAAAQVSRPQRPLSTQFTPPKGHSRRHSLIRQGDFSAAAIAEDARDSISSNSSWMRRLSIRPLSQHGSPRSSILPDSPSLTFSYGSAAPILSPGGTIPPLPPNKLVKRAPSAHANNNGVTRRRSKSHLPALRRPATSHQRSATLQQFQHPSDISPGYSPKYSLDQTNASRDRLPPAQVEGASTPAKDPLSWTSFFHSRTIKVNTRGLGGRTSDSGPSTKPGHSLKRICVNGDSSKLVYLTQMGTLASGSSCGDLDPLAGDQLMVDDHTLIQAENPTSTSTPEGTPSKRARRSISMTFSSPGNWISRAGSIRRPKRGSETTGGKRHVSAPITSNSAGQADVAMVDEGPPSTPRQKVSASRGLETLGPLQAQARKRNSSSPLPPLNRLSSFNIDLSRLGVGSSSQQGRQTQPSVPSVSRGGQNDRASTMNSLDLEARGGFASGDDEDTDFKSDTQFDSIRTVGSTRNRTIETPLESVFDESPPSSAGHQKAKRLSIQEILGRPWDGDNKILEEEEGLPTPVRKTHDGKGQESSPNLAREGRFTFGPASQHYAGDFGRLSLDDELNDEDWTKDDDMAVTNHLSPPAKGSSVNSRHVGPNTRTALAAISGNRSPEARDSTSDRPLSNLFDYSETSLHDKVDVDGHSPRPKTVHGKQDLDVRGGRTAIRKAPTAGHVRSQSVPVVHEQMDSTKVASTKFGTWGLGSKTVSEDWGDDFEFDEGGAVEATAGKDSCMSFVVPAPIQASQTSVKEHTGQIRELSLLVNDLKRLHRHGRDLDMLQGPQAALWKEAEGVIALASPDEETMQGMDSSSVDIPSNISDRFIDDGFDAASLARSEDPFETPETNVSKTPVLRGRHSPRRRSVFSPDDDIFGGSWPLNEESSSSSSLPPAPQPAPPRHSAPPEPPRTPDRYSLGRRDVSGAVKTVMEAMHRSVSEPNPRPEGKLHFDTGSLKALVKQASDLRDVLSDLVRKADPIAPSPARTPRRDRTEARASPAFTQVFDQPGSSPPPRLPHSRSNNSVLSGASMDTSPSTNLGQRMQVMTVN